MTAIRLYGSNSIFKFPDVGDNEVFNSSIIFLSKLDFIQKWYDVNQVALLQHNLLNKVIKVRRVIANLFHNRINKIYNTIIDLVNMRNRRL